MSKPGCDIDYLIIQASLWTVGRHLRIVGQTIDATASDDERAAFVLEIQMGNVISRDDTIIVNLKNTGSTSAVMDENYPIKITSGESSIYPYPHFKYSEDWTGEGFLCADGVPVGMTLSEFLAEDLLPAVPYSDDFAVTYAENVTFRSINLYNTAFELLGNLFDFADLSTLEAGEYYLGIVVNEQGAYIEEAKQYECTGWECLFRLIVK